MFKRIHPNVRALENIDAHLDNIDELIARLELPRNVKRELASLTYQMYSKIEKSIEDFTPSAE